MLQHYNFSIILEFHVLLGVLECLEIDGFLNQDVALVIVGKFLTF
jgi:hypothetical protein